MYKEKLVSVVLPAYRSSGTIMRAISSIQNQTYTHWEALCVDDGSDDDTAKTIRDISATDTRVTLFQHQKRRGAAQARNTAISSANGQYLSFLDADDAWLPTKLEKQLDFMQRQGAALCFTGFTRMGMGSSARRIEVPDSVNYEQLLYGNVIACLTVLCDRTLLGEVVFPDLERRQDYALWLDLLKRVPQAHGLNCPLSIKHEHADSLSAARIRSLQATWSVYRREGFSIPKSTGFLANHLLQRLKRG